MKFLCKYLVIFLAVFIILKTALFILNDGHEINYNIGNYDIKEIYTAKDNNYYFDIKGDKTKLNFQLTANYNKAGKILKKLYYKKINSYQCFYPVFTNKDTKVDVMCIKDNIIYNAGYLKDEQITKEFKKYGYNQKDFTDNAQKIDMSNTQSLYKSNILENSYLALESYKGLSLFNSKQSGVKLFNNDVYKKKLSIFTNKYYVVADYNKEYTFKNFYVVNIINGEVKNIRSYDEISFDSYIMGAVDDEIYLFDKDAQKQFKISIKYETVEEVGNKDNIKYYDSKWKTITLQEALDEKKFDNYYSPKEDYDKVDKVGNYYYFYKKTENVYKVYRSDSKNKKLKTYLFDTTDLNSITYTKNEVYFKNNIDFCYYNQYGTRKLISNTELEFNGDISMGAYEK